MKRSLILCGLALCGAAALNAGPFENEVESLGSDSIERSAAVEELARAGDEAFEDLMDGLALDPDEEGVDEFEEARRVAIQRECVRLLGALGDTRASAGLLEILRGDNPPMWTSTACANALGLIWKDKEASPEREDVEAELTALASSTETDEALRWASLRSLARLGTGAVIAMGVLADDEASDLFRSAAIEVVVSTGHVDAADQLIALWESQRGEEAAEVTKGLGVKALFGLAELGDDRAVGGLIDVATLRDFTEFPDLQNRAIDLLKSDDLRAVALDELVAAFKDVDREAQHREVARTLGELGADGVTTFLAIADDEAPEGEAPDYYKLKVDQWLSSLRSAEALSAFVAAYDEVDPENAELRETIFAHIYSNRRSIDQADQSFFHVAADDETLEAEKRAQAIAAWAESQGKDAFDQLSIWVKSDVPEIRAQATQSLGRSFIPLAKSQPLLVEALGSEGEEFTETRRNALSGLLRSTDEDLLPLFLERLDPELEPDAETRRRAIQAVDGYTKTAGIDEAEVYPALKERLDDADADVRAAALNRLVVMANNLGRTGEATGIVEDGLTDNNHEVRDAAYRRVTLVASDIDTNKVVSAALLEETSEMQRSSVLALSRLDNFGDDAERHERLVDLALRVVNSASHRSYARELLAAIDESAPARKRYITEAVRGRIEEDREAGNHATLPVLIRTLIDIEDVTYFNEVKEMAEIANVELRRACVDYLAETGTTNDIPFLRQLKDRSDSAADAVRGHIDDAIRTLEDRG